MGPCSTNGATPPRVLESSFKYEEANHPLGVESRADFPDHNEPEKESLKVMTLTDTYFAPVCLNELKGDKLSISVAS